MKLSKPNATSSWCWPWSTWQYQQRFLVKQLNLRFHNQYCFRSACEILKIRSQRGQRFLLQWHCQHQLILLTWETLYFHCKRITLSCSLTMKGWNLSLYNYKKSDWHSIGAGEDSRKAGQRIYTVEMLLNNSHNWMYWTFIKKLSACMHTKNILSKVAGWQPVTQFTQFKRSFTERKTYSPLCSCI